MVDDIKCRSDSGQWNNNDKASWIMIDDNDKSDNGR